MRRLTVTKQRLAGKLPRKASSEDILSVVRDTCYIQWDPIDAVAPSHVVAIWSRVGNYRIADLDRLMWNEKKLFLYWAPVASIVLTEDYPIYSALMRRYSEFLANSTRPSWAKARKFLADHKELRKKMLNELKKIGPLQVKEFQDYVRTGRSEDGWGSGSDISNMLHYLTVTGEILVVGHKGLQNIWGLAEEFLPSSIDRTRLTDAEFEREAAQRALRALGTAFEREIYLYYPRDRYLNLKKTLEDLEREGKIHRIHVEGLGRNSEQYVHDKDLRLLESIDSEDFEPRVTLIAPWDNLLCNLARTKRLFEFDYIHENFLPENKRKYGTFVHPILYGDKLIGRTDLHLDKENKTLKVLSIHAEADAPSDKETATKIRDMIREFAEFIGAKQVEYTSRIPTAWKSSLR